MTDFEVDDTRSYGVVIDLRPYNKEYVDRDIYSAVFADNESMPRIVKKNSGLVTTYYKKRGNGWHSETLSGKSHKLPESSVEHDALELLSMLHGERVNKH